MWQKDGIITITNFLPLEQAEHLRKYLLDLPEDKWNVSVHPYHPAVYTFSNTPENHEHITNGIKSANAGYDAGQFSYCFKRFDGYNNDGIRFQDFMTSKDVLSVLRDITGFDISEAISIFGSCYSGNSFLSTHTDTGRGKIALVYNLTKDWDEDNGGCFELLTPDWQGVKKRVLPLFNSLTIFDVRGDGVPHRVTRIKPEVTEKRVAFSGWLI